MATWSPDPTFYPSPKMAMDAPREELAYVAILNPDGTAGPTRWRCWTSTRTRRATRKVVGRLDLPNVGDELHHFGWNACSAALCPNMPHPHVERRYLLVPGLRSSRMYILDTKPDPQQPEDRQDDRAGRADAEERLQPAAHRSTAARTRSTSARSARPDGNGPGGIFQMDHRLRHHGPVGEGPRAAAPGLRLLVAPRATT